MSEIAPDGSPLALYRASRRPGSPSSGVDGQEWRQTFRARLLERAGLEQLLGGAGWAWERWLDRPGWFVARPR